MSDGLAVTSPVVLCVVDGLGHRDDDQGNAVRRARTPHLDALASRGAQTLLRASGEAVGLPPGDPGDGAAGYRALGAGRVAPRADLARVDAVVADEQLAGCDVLELRLRVAEDRKQRLHLLVPVTEHAEGAALARLQALLEVIHDRKVQVVVHALLDGRHASAKSAWNALAPLEALLEGKGVVGTLCGARFALDREGRFDRTFRAYAAIVRGEAPRADTTFDAFGEAYARGEDDTTLEPVRIAGYEGTVGSFMADFTAESPTWDWWGEEAGLVVSARPDRVHQLVAMLTRSKALPDEAREWLTERGREIHAYDEFGLGSLFDLDPAFGVPVAYPAEPLGGTLGDALAAAGVKQLRVAGTGRGEHVATFLDGGRRPPLPGETRVACASDAAAVRRAVAALAEGAGGPRFVLLSLGEVDAALHEGDLDEAVAALERVDAAVGEVARAAEAASATLLVTASHGGAERLRDAQDRPLPGHTTSPVPLRVAGAAFADAGLREGGALTDVAPTVLDLLGVPLPQEMTGRSLRTRGASS